MSAMAQTALGGSVYQKASAEFPDGVEQPYD